ncbi:hypothetical protein RKD18_007951 [Streptomyces phaeoluteigriseus]
MGDSVTEMDKRGQEPADEQQPVLRAGAHGPLPRSSGKPCLVTLLSQRVDPLDEFNNTPVVRPVIRRLLMIIAGVEFTTA